MNMFGKWPAVVTAWDRERRECRVSIPGVTDGADTMPLAEIEYPIGDKSEHTELRVIVGDRVWVEFIRGDPRYPLITGWRTKRTGNDNTKTRRHHHENFERHADAGDIHDHASDNIRTEAGANEAKQVGQEYTLDAGAKITLHVGGSTIVISGSKVTVTSPKFEVVAPMSTFSGMVTIQGVTTMLGGMAVSGNNGTGHASSITGNTDFTGQVSANGKRIDDSHKHGGVATGLGSSASVA